MTLNGRAVPDDILDRELYGAPGSGEPPPYPSVPRYLAAAQGGTLYVDDICRMSERVQARLLQLLRTRRIVAADGRVHAVRRPDHRRHQQRAGARACSSAGCAAISMTACRGP